MILDLYLARRFLTTFLGVFGVFLALSFLIGMLEQIRRFDAGEVGFVGIIKLTLLNTPRETSRILPLIMTMATLTFFMSLARSSELVVIRSTGRSVYRTLFAPVSVAFMIGVGAVAIVNPIVASTSNQYEIVAARNAERVSSFLSLSREGLWLRQGGRDGQVVIRAARSNQDGTILSDVTFFEFGPDGAPGYRIEAESATLGSGIWQLESAKKWHLDTSANPERESTVYAELDVPTGLTADRIRESFGTPDSISIWELPDFIDRLERAGLSPLRHRVWMNMELALPVMLTAMALVGAGIFMRHTGYRRTSTMVILALALGFALHFIRNFAQILGENGQIPVLLAAWCPPVAAIMLTAGIILNLEYR